MKTNGHNGTRQSQAENMNESRERERMIQSTPKGAESFSLRFTLITQIVSSFSQPFDLIIRMIKIINSIQITMIKVEVKIDKLPNDRKSAWQILKIYLFCVFWSV